MRGAAELEALITDADGKTVLRRLGAPTYVRKLPLYYVAAGQRSPYTYPEYTWDGTLYDRGTGELVPAAEGSYNYRLRARMGEAYDWQEINLPVKIDNTPPDLAETPEGDIDTWPVGDDNDSVVITYRGVTDSGVGLDDMAVILTWISPEGPQSIPRGLVNVEAGDGDYEITIRNLSNFVTTPDALFSVSFMDYAGNLRTRLCEVKRSKIMQLAKLFKTEDGIESVLQKNDDNLVTYNKAEAEALGFEAGKARFDVPATDDFVSIAVNGTAPLDPNREPRRFELDVEDGVTVPLTVVGKDAADGETVLTGKLLYDETPPTVSIDNEIKTNSQGIDYIQLEPYQYAARISGTVSDNSTERPKLRFHNGMGVKWLAPTPGENIFVDPFVMPSLTPVQLTPFDAAGNEGDTRSFMVLASDIDPENIPLPEEKPDTNVMVEITTPGFERLLNEGVIFFRGDENDTESTVVTIGGRSSGVQTLIFGDERTEADAEGNWTIDIKLVRGLNTVRFDVITPDGNELGGMKLRIFFDNRLPNTELFTDPAAIQGAFVFPEEAADPGDGPELLIVGREPECDIRVFGSVSDDTQGYRLFVNGDLLVEQVDFTDKTSPVIEEAKAFDTVVPAVKDKEFIRVEYADASDYGDDITFVQKYQYRVDDEAPMIEPLIIVYGEETILTDNEKHELEGQVRLDARVRDNLDPDATVTITVNGERYMDENGYATADGVLAAGVYSVRYTAEDATGNRREQTFMLTVYGTPEIDTSAVPREILLKEAAAFDPLEGVTATDAVDGDLTEALIVNPSGITLTLPGEYTFVYVVTNRFGKTAQETVTVSVIGPPALFGVPETVTVTQGSAFDPLEGVTAADGKGRDLTEAILVEGTFDLDEPGTYTLTLSVSDAYGQTVQKTLTLIVAEKDDPTHPNRPVDPTNPVLPDEPGAPGTPVTGEHRPSVAGLLLMVAGALTVLIRRRRGWAETKR